MTDKRNLIWLTGASSAQVVIQFLIQVVLAYQFGARADADALAAALVVPTLLAAVISGSLSYVLVPELVACFTDPSRPISPRSGNESTGWRIAGWFGLISGLIALAVSVLVMMTSPAIVNWLYGSLLPEQRATSAHLLSILSWQIVMSTLVSWSLAVHHSRHSFVIPAMGGVWGTLLTLLIAVRQGPQGIHWIAIAINAGSLVSMLIHVAPLVTKIQLGSVPWKNIERLLWALLPLVLGGLYLRIEPVVDRSLASQLDEGSVAHLHYAQRMIVALLSISTSGLSVIAFPQLAGRLASDGRDGFVSHFALAMRRLVLIVVPIAIGFGCFAVPVIADLLQRGRFTAADSQAVGGLIVCFIGMFIGASWCELLARGFYALGDTRTPTIVGAVTLTIGLTVKWFSLPYAGVWGIAGSTSLAFLLTAISMSVLLARQTNRLIFAGCFKMLLVAIMASLAACAASFLPYAFSLGRSWVAAPVGAIVYGALVYPWVRKCNAPHVHSRS